jgi:hypothetical protein
MAVGWMYVTIHIYIIKNQTSWFIKQNYEVPTQTRNEDADKHQAPGCQFQPQLSMA